MMGNQDLFFTALKNFRKSFEASGSSAVESSDAFLKFIEFKDPNAMLDGPEVLRKMNMLAGPNAHAFVMAWRVTHECP